MFILMAQIEHKWTVPVWSDLDSMGWRVTSSLRKTFLLYLRKGNSYRVCFNGTNQAQMNGADLEQFERYGVECDVTNQHKWMASFWWLFHFIGCQFHVGFITSMYDSLFFFFFVNFFCSNLFNKVCNCIIHASLWEINLMWTKTKSHFI